MRPYRRSARLGQAYGGCSVALKATKAPGSFFSLSTARHFASGLSQTASWTGHHQPQRSGFGQSIDMKKLCASILLIETHWIVQMVNEPVGNSEANTTANNHSFCQPKSRLCQAIPNNPPLLRIRL